MVGDSAIGEPSGQRIAQDGLAGGRTLPAAVDHDHAVEILRTGALETLREQSAGCIEPGPVEVDSLAWLMNLK